MKNKIETEKLLQMSYQEKNSLKTSRSGNLQPNELSLEDVVHQLSAIANKRMKRMSTNTEISFKPIKRLSKEEKAMGLEHGMLRGRKSNGEKIYYDNISDGRSSSYLRGVKHGSPKSTKEYSNSTVQKMANKYGDKIKTRGMNRNQLLETLTDLQGFLNAKQSTKRGEKEVKQQMKKSLSVATGLDINKLLKNKQITEDQIKKMWNAIDFARRNDKTILGRNKNTYGSDRMIEFYYREVIGNMNYDQEDLFNQFELLDMNAESESSINAFDEYLDEDNDWW